MLTQTFFTVLETYYNISCPLEISKILIFMGLPILKYEMCNNRPLLTIDCVNTGQI